MRITRIVNKSESIKDEAIDLSQMDVLLDKYKNKSGSLIPLLQGTQSLFGYVPSEAFKKISDATDIPVADIYGVATFYAQFRLSPVGKNIIRVCHAQPATYKTRIPSPMP